MFIRRDKPSLFYLLIKRIFDIICSSLALILLIPVFAIAVVCIKAEDGGPVMYTQKRYTLDGIIFEIYKFRSMKENAENDGTEGTVTF